MTQSIPDTRFRAGRNTLHTGRIEPLQTTVSRTTTPTRQLHRRAGEITVCNADHTQMPKPEQDTLQDTS